MLERKDRWILGAPWPARPHRLIRLEASGRPWLRKPEWMRYKGWQQGFPLSSPLMNTNAQKAPFRIFCFLKTQLKQNEASVRWWSLYHSWMSIQLGNTKVYFPVFLGSQRLGFANGVCICLATLRMECDKYLVIAMFGNFLVLSIRNSYSHCKGIRDSLF